MPCKLLLIQHWICPNIKKFLVKENQWCYTHFSEWTHFSTSQAKKVMTLFLYCPKLSQITPPPLFFHLSVTGSINYIPGSNRLNICTVNLFKLYTEAAFNAFLSTPPIQIPFRKKSLTIPFPRTKAFVSGQFFFYGNAYLPYFYLLFSLWHCTTFSKVATQTVSCSWESDVHLSGAFSRGAALPSLLWHSNVETVPLWALDL